MLLLHTTAADHLFSLVTHHTRHHHCAIIIVSIMVSDIVIITFLSEALLEGVFQSPLQTDFFQIFPDFGD